MTTPVACDIILQSIDLDHLDDVEDNLEAVQFTVVLSEAPSDTWIAEFQQLYHRMSYELKPPASIEGDKLTVIYLPRYANELPQYFAFLRNVVLQACRESHRTEDIHKAHLEDSRKAQVRDALSKIKLS